MKVDRELMAVMRRGAWVDKNVRRATDKATVEFFVTILVFGLAVGIMSLIK